MSTKPSELFPAEGLRKLSAKEQLRRAKALNCTIPSHNKPECSKQLHIGIFFDGTGNNRKLDYEERPLELRRHSNIVKLFNAYRTDPKDGRFAFYIPGVGTPFPEIGDKGGRLGSIAAWDGETRIIWAFMMLLNAPVTYTENNPLISVEQAKRIARNLSSSGSPALQRRIALHTWQDKLQARIENSKPKIEQINLSVFGFSRGAAEARAFTNWLFDVCEQGSGGWTFAGIPIRLHFLGIFDTVASVGLADLFGNGIVEGHQSWADDNMEIHPGVEQCVHFVAGHEVRGCFPLDSVRVGGKYPGNAMEVMYPGAHSDVGGGYAPGDLGVSQRNEDMLARIPGYDMYIAALKAGVPLLPWSELPQLDRDDFLPSKDVQQRYNAYVRDAKIQPGPVEKLHHAHMSLFFSYRFKYRATFRQRPFFKNASQKDQTYLAVTERTLNERLRSLQYPVPVTDAKFDPREALKLRRNSMRAAGLQSQDESHIPNRELYRVVESINVSLLTPAIESLFDYDVHDSMAGFVDMGVNEYDGRGSKIPTGNGMGIVRFRKIFTENG